MWSRSKKTKLQPELYFICLIVGLSITIVACNGSGHEPAIGDNLENIRDYSTIDHSADQLETAITLEFFIEESLLLGNTRHIAVDKHGNIYLADDIQSIQVYHPDGQFVKNLGNTGDLIFAFQRLSGIEVYNNYLFAYDFELMQMTVFDLNKFKPLRSFPVETLEREELPDAKLYSTFKALGKDSLIVVLKSSYAEPPIDSDRNAVLALIGSDGKVLNNQILEFPQREMLVEDEGERIRIVQPPYGNRNVLALMGDTIYHGWSDELMLKKYNLDGDYLSGFYHSPPLIPLEKEEVLAQYDGREREQQIIKDAGIPDYRPAFHSLLADEEAGRLWIGLYSDEPDLHDWWVMDGNGQMKGEVSLPQPVAQSAMSVRDDEVHLVIENKDGELKVERHKVKIDD